MGMIESTATNPMEDAVPTNPVSLLEREIPHLRRYGRFLARDVEVADDLVQECLLRAIENMEKWEPGTNLRAWLVTILRNIFFNQCRRAKLDREARQVGNACNETISAAAQEDVVALSELAACFSRLSPDHKEILHLIVAEGLSYEEAASVLQVQMGTVKSRLSRARSELKLLTEGHDQSPSEDGHSQMLAA